MQTQHIDLLSKRITFSLGESIFCIPIVNIQEVIQMTNITSIPGAYESVLGVINLRGDVITVFDPKPLMGLKLAASNSNKNNDINNRIIILHSYNSENFAICVDAVHEVVTLTEQIKYIDNDSINKLKFVNSIFEIENKMVMNIDIDEFSSSSVFLH